MSAQIKHRQLGSTGLNLSELGLGTAAMAGNHRPVSEEDHRGAIEEALNAGVTFVDTAPQPKQAGCFPLGKPQKQSLTNGLGIFRFGKHTITRTTVLCVPTKTVCNVWG